MTQPSPDRLPDLTGGRQPVPAHHRPPNVAYDEYGRPHHVVLGQAAPAPIIVQLPEQQGMSREQREFMLTVVMWLVVAIVGVALACTVVVICGGTLMGIISAVGSNATQIGIVLVAAILAAGWAASKIKPGTRK